MRYGVEFNVWKWNNAHFIERRLELYDENI